MPAPGRAISRVLLAAAIGVGLTAAALADSFTIRCDWFDRGNVDTERVAKPYSDKYPCIVNGGVVPNQAEYDLDFPVAGQHAISVLYAAASSAACARTQAVLRPRAERGHCGNSPTACGGWGKAIVDRLARDIAQLEKELGRGT